MNRDQLAGKWLQLTGEIRTKWGRLTHDQLLIIAGSKAKLAGILEERYGIAQEEAEEEAEHQVHGWLEGGSAAGSRLP